MAHASWVSPNKVSGSGNDSVSWSASEHTGRAARQTTAVFKAAGVDNKTLTINQAGKAEFVEIDATAAILKTGGSLTISGRSNSSKLTFALTGNNGIELNLPAKYTANGLETNNGAAISGDPGAAQEYVFSITFADIPENTSIAALVSQLTVTANGGQSDSCEITQAAGDPYLNITPVEINLTAAGTAVSVSVISNTSWSVE